MATCGTAFSPRFKKERLDADKRPREVGGGACTGAIVASLFAEHSGLDAQLDYAEAGTLAAAVVERCSDEDAPLPNKPMTTS